MNIYFVRHAETKGNKEGRFRGRTDYPLNKNGKNQSKLLRDAIKNIDYDIIYSSPMSRSYETAEIINHKNIKIKKEELINNIDVGKWGGEKKDKIEKEYPELWRTWWDEPENIKFPGGESMNDLMNRSDLFMKKIKKTNHENIIAVTHRSVLKCIFATILGLKKDFFWKFYFNNASYSRVATNIDGGFTIMQTNESCHLNKFVVERR